MSEQLWFLFAIAGAIIGAVVQVLDMYLSKDGIFSHPIEPTVVSGVMQAMLWASLPFVGFEYPESGLIAGIAVLGGILHISSLFFYFKVVFSFAVSFIASSWQRSRTAIAINTLSSASASGSTLPGAAPAIAAAIFIAASSNFEKPKLKARRPN